MPKVRKAAKHPFPIPTCVLSRLSSDAPADGSDWAGLFFALNLVRHADFAVDPDLVAGLRGIVSWLRVGTDDPVHALLDRLDIGDRLQSAGQGLDAAAFVR